MKKHILTGKEIAIRRDEDTWKYLLHRLPDPDTTLHNTGSGLESLRQLTFDAQVYAAMQQRIAGSTYLKWQIRSGTMNEDVASLLTQVFTQIDMERLIPQILDAVFFGFSVLEISWSEMQGKIIPVKIEEKPQEWFFFDEQNNLRLKSNTAEGSLLPEGKFLLVQHAATYANPYGEKALSRCYWPVQFKQSGYRFWVTFIERYGMPFLAARQPRSYTNEEAENLLKSLEKMMNDTFGVIPDDSSVEFVQSSQSATSEVYNKFLAFCNNEIAKAIIAQTLTTEVQERGSYAAARTHQNILRHITMADKRMIEKAVNAVIQLIITLNYTIAPGTGLPVFELYAEDDSNRLLAERDRLLRRQGVLFNKQYYMRNYNLKEDEFSLNRANATAAVNSFG